MRNRTRKSPKLDSDTAAATLPTFMDHVRELQGRLFAVAIVFVALSAAAYPFFDKIVSLIVAPLGKDHELVYLTPGGAFSFIIQVCMYIGFVAALPVVIYNLYRFIMPIMKKSTIKTALVYTGVSFILAIVGMLFAYVVSLPAALYFLTSFNLYHINPMLTVDSYFSFIMTYMIVGALLFQIPLVMLLINGATPLKPKKLMSYQGKILLGSFIIAAIVSPTPDALNQTLLASPMVVMYQVGIILIWLKNRKTHQKVDQTVAIDTNQQTIADIVNTAAPLSIPVHTVAPITIDVNSTINTVVTIHQPARAVRSIDGFAPRGTATMSRPVPQLQRRLPTAERQQPSPLRRPMVRSVDGFLMSPQS